MIQPSKTNPCATPVNSQNPEQILLLLLPPSIPTPKNPLNSRTNNNKNDDDEAPPLLLLLFLLSQTFLPLPVIRANFTPIKASCRREWRRCVQMTICVESVLRLTLTHVILDWWERGRGFLCMYVLVPSIYISYSYSSWRAPRLLQYDSTYKRNEMRDLYVRIKMCMIDSSSNNKSLWLGAATLIIN